MSPIGLIHTACVSPTNSNPTEIDTMETNPTRRYDPDDAVDFNDVSVGDRLAREIVPPSYNVPSDDHRSKHYQVDSDKPFVGRLVARNTLQHSIRHCLLVDDTGRFARLSAHSTSQAWAKNQEDWKVRDLGSDPQLTSAWDIEIDDLGDMKPEEFVAEWVRVLFDNIRHEGDLRDVIRNFNGNTFTLADNDGRWTTVKYTLSEE